MSARDAIDLLRDDPNVSDEFKRALTPRQIRQRENAEQDRVMFRELERYEQYCRDFIKGCGKHPAINFSDYLLMVKAGERPTV